MFRRNKVVEPAPRLRIEPSATGGPIAVAVTGELDVATGRELLAFAESLTGVTNVSFDLTGIYFIDSSGLNALLRTVQGLRQRGVPAVVTSAASQALKLFDVSGLRDPLMRDGMGPIPTW